MTRDISATLATRSQDEVVQPIAFVEAVFDSGTLRLWTGWGDLVNPADGNTYSGSGDLLSFSDIRESLDLSAEGFEITLSGIDATDGSPLDSALTENYQGRSITIWIGLFYEGSVVSDPIVGFSGFMDVLSIKDSGTTISIAMSAEHELVSFKRTKVRRYTPEDQKINHPTDKGFDFVPTIQELNVTWGGKYSTSTTNSNPSNTSTSDDNFA